MHILLTVLRWAGLVLIVLVLLLLVLAMCLLFVPVRYRIAGVWKDKKEGEVHLTWLFHLLHLRAGYGQRAEGFWYDLRVLGFSIFNSRSGDKNAEKRTEPATRSSGNAEKTKQAEGAKYKHEQSEEEPCLKSTDKEEPYKEEPYKEEQAVNKTSAKKTSAKKTRIKKPLIKRMSAKKKKQASGKRRAWKNPFKRLVSLRRSLGQLKQKWEFLTDEKNLESFRFLLRQGRRLLAHIRPRKGRMNIEFGFDDPAVTGQALAAYSLIYPFLHEHLEVIPQFEQTMFEAEGELKGRLCVAVLLWLLWEIFRDRHTWALLRNTPSTAS